MTSNFKQSSLLLMVLLSITFFSCNNAENQKSNDPETEDSVVVVATDTTAFKPFDIVDVSVVVKDYAKWRLGFDADSAARKASGVNFTVVAAEYDKPNTLSVILEQKIYRKRKILWPIQGSKML